jgi:hypothetical protein
VRLNAYVLAGDPAWVPESLGSYYGLVDSIVVSYDRSGRSWSGAPLSIDESLRRIAAFDVDRKTVLLPGDHADVSRNPVRVETTQRQAALDAAAEGADWVLQLDTDEIVAAPQVFSGCIVRADEGGADALAYPARTFYARSRSGLFLEQCGRFWTPQAGYPGPVAVRAGTTLSVARQTASAPLFRVDMAAWNTDPAHPRETPVHAIVAPEHAILHMSWVRNDAQMREKSVVSGYATTQDWERELPLWRRRSAHPRLTALGAPFARNPFRRFRTARLPAYARTTT